MVVAKSNKGSNETTKLAEVLFEEFVSASDSVDILLTFHKLKAAVGAENVDNGRELYALLKSKLQSWKCKSLWDVLDARAKHKEYGNQKLCEDTQVLVIGSGPIGLRTAIEIALLGAKVIVVEKRTAFSRNNVLHLWPFLIHDFRSLGAKKFYGKFCSGSLDHIGIRMLQCMLMKAALILGVQIYTGVTFENVVEPTGDSGWRCQVLPPSHPVSQFDLDMVVGADGKKNVLPDFPQIEMRGSLAIGITLNLVYHGTKEEAAIPEVSGLAYHFKPEFFKGLFQKSGVLLENFVYYKGETHYFVMTAVKSSLLKRGALLMDYSKPADLLAPQNVNNERLMEYALDAVKFGTEGKLTDVEFVRNDRGKADIAVFDFTSLKKAEHAARIVERKGHRLLLALVGDSLIEPFWPTGSGCARGVLSALDTAWMLRSFSMDRPPLQVLSERENIYKLLSATSVDNLRKKYSDYTINPFTRYGNLDLKRVKEVYHLYDSDDPVNADFRVGSPTSVGSLLENKRRGVSHHKPAKQRKSSSDDLDEKKGRNRARKSSSDDLDEKKDTKGKNRRKSIKKALSRSHSRDTESELNDVTSKKNKNKKRRSQSSESADEKEVRGRRQRRLGRTKSRDTDGSNNSLDTITESPKKKAKDKEEPDKKDYNVLMKQRSTKRWRLFGGTKPKLKSVDKGSKSDSNEDLTGKKLDGKKSKKAAHERKEAPENEAKTAPPEKQAENTTHTGRTGATPVTETYAKSTLRQLNSQESSPTPLRNSLRKPSELRASQNTGFTRSISSGAATLPRPNRDSQVKRTNSDIRKTERVFTSLRQARQEKKVGDKMEVEQAAWNEETGAEKEKKRVKLEKKSELVFDDIKSLSPAAQRTAPLLKTLTPDKKDRKYSSDGGAITAAAGIAAMLALTTPLAMEAQQTLKEFQIERQKILANSKNVREKIAFLNSGNSTNRTRRDLSSALDNADGVSPKPVKRFFSFSTAQRNVKQKLEEDSQKSLTLPRKVFSRQSLQDKASSAYADIPSALDSAINILIKSYDFSEIQGTLKIMLNIFRCISKDPDDEMPRRISTVGQLFRSLVWDLNEAKLFMVVSGWMELGSFIVFPKTKTVHEPIRVLMQHYRQLWEKQALDTSCPPFVCPESVVKNRRRPSDDVFRENVESGRKDSGSHSGSDSGMGFSETASELNLQAVMPAVNDVISDVTPGDITDKRSSQAMDPRMYLEASYQQDEPVRKLNPSDYLSQSTVTTEHPKTSVPESPKVSQSKPGSSQDSPSKPSPSKSLKNHYWEILEEPASIPQSPEGIQYAPTTQLSRADHKRSSFRDSKRSASVRPVEEPVNDDPKIPPNDPDLPTEENPNNDEVSTKETSQDAKPLSKQRKSKRRNELDDLFDTLDLVREALEPPRVIYEDKATVDVPKPKKSRNVAKSTEASRRREEYTRSKLQGSSAEGSTLRIKRTTRSHTARERQQAPGTAVDNNGQQATARDKQTAGKDQQSTTRDRKTRSRRQQSEIDVKPSSDSTPRSNHRSHTPDPSTNESLRRSQRIAESSQRKAVLVLDSSGYPEESSTDLNQAFVDSSLNESKQEANGSVDHDKSTSRKKKVRRQSSVVKSNKSRARTKRGGYKSRKDRSIDT